MQDRLEVKLADPHGLPYVEIPRHIMWDLVEYLALQRTSVHYTYEAQHFTVFFPKLTQLAAQSLVDDWQASHVANRQDHAIHH